MLGTVLALLVAFFVAGRDAISKIIVKEDDEFVVCWAMALYTFVFLLPFIFFGPLPSLGPGFFKALIVGAILNFLARLTFLKAIKHADLSIVSPLLSFSPSLCLSVSDFRKSWIASASDCPSMNCMAKWCTPLSHPTE